MNRPMCVTKGCESISTFHGFGKDFCWSCYSRWMMSVIHPDPGVRPNKVDAPTTQQIPFSFGE